jgi:hypothetical protein
MPAPSGAPTRVEHASSSPGLFADPFVRGVSIGLALSAGVWVVLVLQRLLRAR